MCFVFVFGGSVNEWMRRKGEDGIGGGGLCRVVCRREGALKGLDENRFTAND